LLLKELHNMSQAQNGQKNPADKKDQQEKNSTLNNDKESSSSEEKSDEPKSKSYAEILKGFEEIEKIFKHDKGKS